MTNIFFRRTINTLLKLNYFFSKKIWTKKIEVAIEEIKRLIIQG